MTRLIDYGFVQLNAMFDALPLEHRLALICGNFDRWVAANGRRECMRCENTADGIGLLCADCATKEPL